MALSFFVFLAGWLTLRWRPWQPRLASWIAVGTSATTSGMLLGVAADKMFYESYGTGGWLHWGALLAAGIASPMLCAYAAMSGRPLPTFLELLGPRDGRTGTVLTVLLGLTLIVTTLIGAETALGFAFDPRYRDFPFASLTMAVVPFAALMLLNRPKEGMRPIAESAFAGVLVIAALYTGAQRRRTELAGDVDLRDLPSARGHAVAGAGRANPRISSPIASPDSVML